MSLGKTPGAPVSTTIPGDSFFDKATWSVPVNLGGSFAGNAPWSIPSAPRGATGWAPMCTVNDAFSSPDIDSLARRVSIGLPELNPQLARNLYDAFRQSPHFDEGLAPFSTLYPSLVDPVCDWQIDRLPLPVQALAYACLSIGVLYTFDSTIIGHSPYDNFASLAPDRDLREYGRRRRPAFEGMRDLALRAAKEAETWMEPSIDNVAACNMLDVITRIDEELTLDSRQTRPFLRSCLSHLMHLISHGDIPPNADQGAAVRTLHLAGHISAEIGRGAITASQEDQDIIMGTAERPTAAAIEKDYRAVLAAPVREQWPEPQTMCLLFVANARAMVTEVLSPQKRRAPVDIGALTRNFQAIIALQSLSELHTQVWNRIIDRISSAAPTAEQEQDKIRSTLLFPHIARRRVRWTRLLAAQAVARFGAYVWATLVTPFVSEVTRRRGEAHLAASINPAPTFAQQHERAQLDLLLVQARALVPLAVEAQVKLWEKSPSLALLALTRPIGLVETFEMWVDLVEAGHLVGIASLARSAGEALRVGGWINSSVRLDNLIDRLDRIALSQTPTSAASLPDYSAVTWDAALFDLCPEPIQVPVAGDTAHMPTSFGVLPEPAAPGPADLPPFPPEMNLEALLAYSSGAIMSSLPAAVLASPATASPELRALGGEGTGVGAHSTGPPEATYTHTAPFQ